MNPFNIYPHVPHDRNNLINFFNRPKLDWLMEGLEDQPFGEYVFWARRIMATPIRKESQYTVVHFRKAHPQDPNMSALDFYKAYQEWRSKQPDEGDLTTPFGHRMFAWFEKPNVFEYFRLAYATIGWHLINLSKDLARQRSEGVMFLEVDWGDLLYKRQAMATIDAALYRMELHNAGVWDLEAEMANDFYWIDLLCAFAWDQKIDFTPYYSTFDKVIARNSDYRWWYSPYEMHMLPEEIQGLVQGDRLILPEPAIQLDLS